MIKTFHEGEFLSIRLDGSFGFRPKGLFSFVQSTLSPPPFDVVFAGVDSFTPDKRDETTINIIADVLAMQTFIGKDWFADRYFTYFDEFRRYAEVLEVVRAVVRTKPNLSVARVNDKGEREVISTDPDEILHMNLSRLFFRGLPPETLEEMFKTFDAQLTEEQLAEAKAIAHAKVRDEIDYFFPSNNDVQQIFLPDDSIAEKSGISLLERARLRPARRIMTTQEKLSELFTKPLEGIYKNLPRYTRALVKYIEQQRPERFALSDRAVERNLLLDNIITNQQNEGIRALLELARSDEKLSIAFSNSSFLAGISPGVVKTMSNGGEMHMHTAPAIPPIYIADAQSLSGRRSVSQFTGRNLLFGDVFIEYGERSIDTYDSICEELLHYSFGRLYDNAVDKVAPYNTASPHASVYRRELLEALDHDIQNAENEIIPDAYFATAAKRDDASIEQMVLNEGTTKVAVTIAKDGLEAGRALAPKTCGIIESRIFPDALAKCSSLGIRLPSDAVVVSNAQWANRAANQPRASMHGTARKAR